MPHAAEHVILTPDRVPFCAIASGSLVDLARPDPAGADAVHAYVERRQVERGASPEAQLEDLTSNTISADRRLVTFTQRFGDEAVRKELTMAREGNAWRIVAERTL